MQKERDLNKDLLTLGIILIILGIIHIIFSNVLSLEWGIVLIALGITSLFYRSKIMLLVFAIALILIGLLNIVSSINLSKDTWSTIGLIQIILGIVELVRYPKVKENPKYVQKEEIKNKFIWYGLRIGFISLVSLRVLMFLIQIESFLNVAVFVSLAISIFLLPVSIIHLNQYKKKALAILSLVFSILGIVLFLIGLFYGIGLATQNTTNSTSNSVSPYTDTELELMDMKMDKYCMNMCYSVDQATGYSYGYDDFRETVMCDCLDYNNKTVFSDVIPTSIYLN